MLLPGGLLFHVPGFVLTIEDTPMHVYVPEVFSAATAREMVPLSSPFLTLEHPALPPGFNAA